MKHFIVKAKIKDGEKILMEQYVCNAQAFGDAENIMVGKFAQELIDVASIGIKPYVEIVKAETETQDNKWHEVKVGFITIDEKGKESKQRTIYLVQGTGI